MGSDFKQWKARLEVAHRKHKVIEKNIDLWRRYYRGDQWSEQSGAGYNEKTVENMVFSNIRTIMPSINLNNPKIYCKPTKKPYVGKDGVVFDTIGASLYWEILMNHYYRHLRIKREIDKSLADALIGPWGLVQLGYTVETEKVQGGEQIEINELIKGESVFVVRRSPKDFRFDTEATDSHLEDARWIAFRWVKPLEDVKANPRYDNTRRLKANMRCKTDGFEKPGDPVMHKAISDHDYGDYGDSEVWQRVEGWDIWDKKTHRMMTYVKDHDRFIYEGRWPIDIEGFPIEIIYFNENPDDAVPISDIEIYRSAQDELNRIHSCQLDHIKRISQRKYLAMENALDPDEMEKLKHGGDGTVVTMRVRDGIEPLKDATISQDIYIVQNGLKNNIREAAGLSAFEKGISQKYDTAAEPTLIGQGTASLRAERLATLEDYVRRVVKKMSVIIAQTMDTHNIPLNEEQFALVHKQAPEKLARIVREDGAQVLYPWISLDREGLTGDYDFEIEVGSTQPTNDATRKADALALYKLMAENPFIKKREGTKYVLDAFNLIESDKFLKSDEEVQKEQMTGMQAKIQAEQAMDAPKRETDLKKTIIKAQTALATHDKGDAQGEMMKNAQQAEMQREKHGMEMHKMAMETEAKREQLAIKSQEMGMKAQSSMLQAALRAKMSAKPKKKEGGA